MGVNGTFRECCAAPPQGRLERHPQNCGSVADSSDTFLVVGGVALQRPFRARSAAPGGPERPFRANCRCGPGSSYHMQQMAAFLEARPDHEIFETRARPRPEANFNSRYEERERKRNTPMTGVKKCQNLTDNLTFHRFLSLIQTLTIS